MRALESMTRRRGRGMPDCTDLSWLPYVVMLATPADLEDFALGFSLDGSHRAAARGPEVRSVAVHRARVDRDAIEIAGPGFGRLARRAQPHRPHRVWHLRCESPFEQIRRYPARCVNVRVTHRQLQDALARLRGMQALNATPARSMLQLGAIRPRAINWLREDVGRHNALDKQWAPGRGECIDPVQGFVLVSSRASYEMVQKAAAAGVLGRHIGSHSPGGSPCARERADLSRLCTRASSRDLRTRPSSYGLI